MIQEFVDRFMTVTPELKEKIAKAPPGDYMSVVKYVAEALAMPEEYRGIDPERIHEINDGDYQGTLVYVIGASGYQPSRYWYVKVSYGSCSGCDTLEAIRNYSDEPLTEDQINEYWTLMLHVVQGLKEMGDEE